MTQNCVICSAGFKASPDSLVVCEHKDGAVHLGCCIDRCSQNKAPCGHSQGVFEKL